MMKAKQITYLLFTLLFCGAFAYAQRSRLKQADQLFMDRSYVEAAKLYNKLPQTQHTLQNLADSYYYNAEMLAASKVYGNLYFLYKDSLKGDYLFRYANTLKALQEYERADKVMSAYLKYPVDTRKFLNHLVKIVPHNYKVKALSKGGNTGDFGVAFYGDTLVFASSRNAKNPIYKWNNRPYLDLYMGELNKEGMLHNVRPFSEDINTKTHESSATFTKDGKKMYFNRTNDKRITVGNDLVANIKIYEADLVNGKWVNIRPLPFCRDEFSCIHPAVSPDGKRLYFSSDMPGSLGGMDLYYVDVYENGAYGMPVNLGNVINTPHREQFPFVAEDGTLYFASDGHEGLGGLDLFLSRSYDDVFAKPINLGPSINSGFDDFAFVIQQGKETGFFASNRSGEDLLYGFNREPNPRMYAVSGGVRDKYTKLALPGTKVNLYNEKDQLIGQLVVGADADYIFNIEPNTKYRIEAFRDLYIPYIADFETNDEGRLEYVIEMVLESYDDAEDIVVRRDDGLTYIMLENIYFEFNKWDITPQAASTLNILVELLKKYPYMEVELGAHTDSRASDAYNMRLSQNRANATLEYLVENGINRKRLKAKGYGERKPLVNCGENCSDIQHAINRRCEFIILK